jgi:hypothetical protein
VQQIEAVRARHPQVGEDDVRRPLLQRIQRLARGRRRAHFHPRGTERRHHIAAHFFFVVDH